MEIRTRETTVSELRKTGISVVGDRAWGIHLCLFYETKDDLLEMVLPYFKAGFESGEYCVWLIPDILTREEARKELSEILSSLGRDPDDRSFEIQSGRDLYLADGRFDRERVRVVWNEKLAHALAEGYEGLRVVGDAFWLDESVWRDFYEYEMELNRSMAGRPMSVLCAYPLAVTGAADVFDVARAHQCAVAKRNQDWEVVETPALKQAKEEIAKLNEELEQRVAERTEQAVRLAVLAGLAPGNRGAAGRARRENIGGRDAAAGGIHTRSRASAIRQIIASMISNGSGTNWVTQARDMRPTCCACCCPG